MEFAPRGDNTVVEDTANQTLPKAPQPASLRACGLSAMLER